VLVQIVMRMGAVVLAGAVLSGCGSGPTVSRDSLQKDIADRLTAAGAKPQSVTCKDDLVGEAGRSARCDVVLSPKNTFEAVVTVTSVQGSVVNYDMKPALSKEQLQASVATLVEGATGETVNSVDCESGLEGDSGAEAFCWVDAGGVTLRRTVEVKNVRGLVLSYDLVPLLPKPQVEAALLDRLQQQLGARPDSAACTDNLEGKPGNSINCQVTTRGEAKTYVVTVTTVDGSTINFSSTPKV
jgi:Domain of unknown function (DUF4333)